VKNRENPQTVRSKEWLLGALLSLMQENKYNYITIKELAMRADLDRKTFYRHFKSMDEILEIPVRNAYFEYLETLQSIPELTFYDAVRVYFEICERNIDILKVLYAQGLFPMILLKLSEYLPIIDQTLMNTIPGYRKVSPWESTFNAGGIWNNTLLWISNGAKESPDEIAKIICSFMPSFYD